jgi:hypothetical protein
MPSLAVGDVCLVTYRGSLNSQRILNTFVYGVQAFTGTPDQSLALDALVAKLNTTGNLTDKYLNCVPADYTLAQIWAQVIRPLRWAKHIYPQGTAGNGGNASVTSNLAMSITRRGARGRRKDVSSLHVPVSGDVSEVNGGFLQTGILISGNALALQLRTLVATTTPAVDWVPVIFNGPTFIDVTPITAAFAQDTVRVMRRRTVGLGE